MLVSYGCQNRTTICETYNKHLSSQISGGQESEIKVIAGPGSLKPVEGVSFLVFPWLLVVLKVLPHVNKTSAHLTFPLSLFGT